MSSLEEIREGRLQKLEKLKSLGINPYPAKVPRDFPISFLKTNFDEQVKKASEISVAGRVMALRGQGAILFAVLFDGTEKIQAIIKKDVLGDENFSSPRTSFFIIACIFSVPSKRTAKSIAPCPRSAITRPATEISLACFTCSSKLVLRKLIGKSRGTLAGYGLIPKLLSFSSF